MKASLAIALALVVAVLPAAGTRVAAAAPHRPNVIVIVTDDQRWDTLHEMPKVHSELVGEGIRYPQAAVTNGLCCPSRTTILTGQFSHTTGVYTNMANHHGGYPAFHTSGYENRTIANWLNRVGYRTGLFGKYLNHYPGGVVPPGWDRWNAMVTTGDAGAYYDYTMYSDADGGRFRRYGRASSDYSTRVIDRATTGFIRSTPASTPVFAYVAPFAPHDPATPDRRDAGSTANRALPRPPNFDEADVSDKPRYIRRLSRFSPDRIEKLRRRYDRQRASLLGVDRMVGDIVRTLGDESRLGDTILLFTSDNGVANGEHRWSFKLTPYEESVKVPLVIRWDGHVAAGSHSGVLASNVDIAPTIAQAVGAPHPATDGQPLLGGTFARAALLLEHLTYRSAGKPDPPSYCALRSARWTYVRYGNGVEELYDRNTDPYEQRNVAYDRRQRAHVRRFRSATSAACMPRPPGWHDSFVGRSPLSGTPPG
jgi:N-acetylglucosamine-6-sulfatase